MDHSSDASTCGLSSCKSTNEVREGGRWVCLGSPSSEIMGRSIAFPRSFFGNLACIADIAPNRRVSSVREFGAAIGCRLTIGTTHPCRRMASSFPRASAVRLIRGGAYGLDRLSTPRISCSPHVTFRPTVSMSRRVATAASDRGRTRAGQKPPHMPAARERKIHGKIDEKNSGHSERR